MLVNGDVAALGAALEGEVIVPDSPRYETIRKPAWAQYAGVRPVLVVRPRTPEDVAEAVAFARGRGLETAVRSGGHCFAGRSTTRGLLLELGELSAVTLSDRLATVGAGASLGEIAEHLEERGRTIVSGACPSVGIAGLTLGGGLGILGRSHGLTCDRLVEAQVVLPDGRIVVCDVGRHEDLFWALRGAGASGVGVVTRFVFETIPAPELTCFRLAWPLDHAVVLLDAWQSWAPDAADELAASLLVNASAEAERPPVTTLFGAMLGGRDKTVRLLDQLVARAGVEPLTAEIEQLAFGAGKRWLTEHAPGAEPSDTTSGEQPAPLAFSKSEFFSRELPREAIAALVEHLAAGRTAGQARELDFTPWGGAYNRLRPDATAFVHREERFLLKHTVTLEEEASPSEQDEARTWPARSRDLVHPWGTGGVFPNFADPDLDDLAPAYHGANRDRLMEVKARYAAPGR